MILMARKILAENAFEKLESRCIYPRIKMHLSQKALAVRLKLEGVELERDCISRIEIGTRFVADYEIKMIAKTLNVSVLWLLGIE